MLAVAVAVVVVVMALEAEVKSGEGEGEGWGTTELKQASRLLFSIMPKRSRPEGAALVLPSAGAKGSFGGERREEGEEEGGC